MRATVRFETLDEQLQIDFGERRLEIRRVVTKGFIFVVTQGYLRHLHVHSFQAGEAGELVARMDSVFQTFDGMRIGVESVPCFLG